MSSHASPFMNVSALCLDDIRFNPYLSVCPSFMSTFCAVSMRFNAMKILHKIAMKFTIILCLIPFVYIYFGD